MTTLKKRETPEQEEYWTFIEKTAQHSRERRPSWAVKIEQDDESPASSSAESAGDTEQRGVSCD